MTDITTQVKKVRPTVEKISYEDHLLLLKTKVPSIKYKDWFINKDYVPDAEDEDYEEFWEYQEKLCKHGFFIEDVYFSGFLYWHLNFWKTEVSMRNEYGETYEEYTNPSFRDNEWILSGAIARAKHYQKGLAIGGARRISKSCNISSYLSYGATLNPHSQNLFVGLNGDDIAVTTAKVGKGLNEIPEYFQWMRIKEDWSKQVTLGIKDTKGKKTPFSEIFIRNLENGKKEESIAGTKPSTLVIEESAKGSFLRGFKAAVPGFTSAHGWVCSPLVIFTGGDMDNYHDSKNLFMNPHSHNFLEFDCPEGKRDQHGNIRKHGLFMGNKYRQEAKDLITFGEYLGIENPKSDLYNIPFWVSNEDYANQILEEELDRLITNPDKQLFHKEVMYFPKTVDDMFLNVGTNMYNTKACLQQQQNIELNGITGIPVELYSDGTKICWKDSNKEYIREFPVERQSKDAPIMIYEFPETNAPKFLYVAGIDPFRQDSSASSDSLGACYIYKRMHSLTGEGMRDSFVASYVARPDTQEEWEENVRMLLMFYNAYALVENDEYSFCKYMLTKGSAELYLSPQPAIYKTLVVNGSQNRQFGLSRAAKKVREYLNSLLKNYLEETIHTTYNEDGSILEEIKGVTRVLDHTLLSELIGFGPDVNVDRQVAASLAIAMAIELDPMLGTKIGEESKQGQQTIDKAFNNIKKKTFKSSGSSFSGSRKLFKR